MRDHHYCVYIVASRSHTLYIGVTSAIERRIREHKSGAYEGFTKQYNCNRLVLLETFTNVQRAIAREKQLKGWSRAKKLWLIERSNPTWQDLSESWGRPLGLLAAESTSQHEPTHRSLHFGCASGRDDM